MCQSKINSHQPCSHVFVACKHAHHNFARYISHVIHIATGLSCLRMTIW